MRSGTRQLLRWRILACLVVGTVVLGSAAAQSVSAAPHYPVSYNLLGTLTAGTFSPDTPPPGANRPGCRSTEHPRPVILVHGTGANQSNSWQAIGPELANRGYCVYTVTVGSLFNIRNFGELDSVYTSAAQLAAFVEKVRHWTGAEKVDLVGHSQGGTVNLFYLKHNDGWRYVHRVVGLAAANNPPTFWVDIMKLVPGWKDVVGLIVPATKQLLTPAEYTKLSPRVYPSVRYSNIVSQYDELAIPHTVAFLPSGPNVRNIRIQDVCPNDRVGHLGMIADPNVTQVLLNELDPERAKPVRCGPGGFFL